MTKKLVPFIIMLLVTVFVYREGIFQNDTVLVSNDYNTSSVVWRQLGSADNSMNGVWFRDYMAGLADQILPYNLFLLTIKAFDPFTSLTMVYFLGTLLTGFFFYLFMRSYGLSRLASLFGGVSLMLSNHFLTVLYPGHASKFMTFIWIPLVFLFLRKAVHENRWTHYLYAGFFFGLAMQGQFYEAVIFFLILSAGYWLYLLLQKRETGTGLILFAKSKFRLIIKHKAGFIVMLMMLSTMSLQLIPGMLNLSKNTSVQQQSSEANWDFATAWSLPPEEVLELVVPGVFGWKTGDPEMPYWGRMGKPSVASGLKLNSENVGMITAVLALLAFVLLRKKRGSEAWFWMGVVVLSLIFSFGRHLPILYGPFYHLPLMNSIRNPNKVLWLTMFAFSFMGAMGFNLLFEQRQSAEYRQKLDRFGRKLGIAVLFMGGLTLLSLAIAPALRDLVVGRTIPVLGAQNVGPAVEGVLNHIPLAFLLATVFAGAVWLAIYLTKAEKKARTVLVIAGAIIFLMGLDLWLSGRHFIKYTPRESTIQYDGTFAVDVQNGQLAGIGFHQGVPDPLIKYLKEKTMDGQSRVYVMHNRLTDFYTRHLFPYHEIPCVNFNQNPRMPKEYLNFMQATGYGSQALPLLALHNLSVRDIVSLEPLNQTNLQLPVLTSFPLTTWPGKHMTGLLYKIYGLTNSLPRTWLAHSWRETASLEASMRAMQSTNDLAKFSPVIMKQSLPSNLRPLAIETAILTMSNDRVRITDNGQTRLAIEVETSSPGLLILHDAWHKDWHAEVNGLATPIIPVNILFRGLAVPAGKSLVRFEYRPHPTLYKATMAGYIFILLLAVGECIYLRRKRDKLNG
jgi:hypothetical protein